MAAGRRLSGLRERAQAMLDRVSLETRAVAGEQGAQAVRDALGAALALRDAAIDDDHDPRMLHPARTIRILIADGGCRSIDALAAAAFVDTVDPLLAPPAPGNELAAFLDTVPLPDQHDNADLLERIVTADHDAALVALAERLDQARHLHLRTDLDPRPFHTQVRVVYAAAARRFSPVIARRFDHWADAFERRLILPR